MKSVIPEKNIEATERYLIEGHATGDGAAQH